jgi:hypothetical protein
VRLDASGDKILPVRQRMMIFFETHQAALAAEIAERIDDLLQVLSGEADAPMNFNRREPRPWLTGK